MRRCRNHMNLGRTRPRLHNTGAGGGKGMRGLILVLATLVLTETVAAQSLADLPERDEPKISVTAGEACIAPEPDRTSYDYLTEVAMCLHGPGAEQPDARRVTLIHDVAIKSWSYAMLNKGAFWLAVALAVLVLVWPSIVAIAATGPKRPAGAEPGPSVPLDATAPGWLRLLRNTTVASALQTSIAALAALSFAFYAHYKGNQVSAENLMREVIYTETLGEEQITAILAKIAAMDKGFSFAKTDALMP